MMALDDQAQTFIDTVLALRPRVAAFDCDDTLWSGDSGAAFFYWEIERGLLPKQVVEWIAPRYDEYLRGNVAEDVICGEMVAIHAGLNEREIAAAAEEFFAANFERRIFPEMHELVSRLQQAGCEIWAVSSTNEWVVRAGVQRFGIPPQRVLAACVHMENGCATGRLRDIPTDEGKARSITATIPNHIDAALGNSIHDREMLALARHPFAVNPTPELQDVAKIKGWPLYFPQLIRSQQVSS